MALTRVGAWIEMLLDGNIAAFNARAERGRPDLRNADLRAADLRGANLRSAESAGRRPGQYRYVASTNP